MESLDDETKTSIDHSKIFIHHIVVFVWKISQQDNRLVYKHAHIRSFVTIILHFLLTHMIFLRVSHTMYRYLDNDEQINVSNMSNKCSSKSSFAKWINEYYNNNYSISIIIREEKRLV